MEKKKLQFIEMVHTLCILYQNKYNIPIYKLATVMGKSYKVTATDMLHHVGNLSDKALDFVNYQLYLTDERPDWYTGPDLTQE